MGVLTQWDSPSSQPPSLETDEDRSDKLAKAGRIDRINLVGCTVPEIVVVQCAPREAHTLRSLIVLKQPLHLQMNIEETDEIPALGRRVTRHCVKTMTNPVFDHLFSTTYQSLRDQSLDSCDSFLWEVATIVLAVELACARKYSPMP